MVNDTGGGGYGQELEIFLPREANGASKFQITPKKDAEIGNSHQFNPFAERKNEHPTSDMETLVHLLKASLGTGILAMPIAFMYSGLLVGIIGTIITAFICTHCAYILVKCAHTLYVKTRRTKMSFPDVAETAFLNGPKWGRKFAKSARLSIQLSLFVAYFGTCSVYTVIIATNIKQVVTEYTHTMVSDRVYIAALLIPLILIAWVPNLKYLAPVSIVANGFMAVGLAITFYYLVVDLPAPTDTNMYVGEIYTLPSFVAITIFAMEAIGVVMPLENQMKTPQNFIGIFGVLNLGMSGVALVYMLLGFLGYLRYGSETMGSITLNLPNKEIPAQIVKILIALAVYCTFALQFFVCVEIAWDSIKNKFVKRPTLVNYVLRTVLVTAAVLLAVAVPTISPFISLIGAFSFSILGLLIPVFIEMVTYWDEGFGAYNWIIWKNIIICIFGIVALIFGSKSAIEDIIDLYQK